MEANGKIVGASWILEGKELVCKYDHGVLIKDGMIQNSAPMEVLCRDKNICNVEYYQDCCLMPGMIDCHNHLSWDCHLVDYPGKMLRSEAELTITGLETMKRDLNAGVTFSRYMGDPYFIDVLFKKLQKQGEVCGPGMLTAGVGIRSSAGHGYVGKPFDGIDDIVKAVRKNIVMGADWVKFYTTGVARKNGICSCYYTRKEIYAVIDTAHRAGLPVTCHCIGGQGLKDCVEAGIDCLEHVYFISEPELKLVQKNGTMLCLTMSEYFTEKEMIPFDMKLKFEEGRNAVRKSMELVIQSGVPFVLGTDGMHGELAEEAVYAVSLGADNKKVLKALTTDASAYLGTGNVMGCIEEGKRADMLIVSGNPMDNIESLSKVRAVYQGGTKVERK